MTAVQTAGSAAATNSFTFFSGALPDMVKYFEDEGLIPAGSSSASDDITVTATDPDGKTLAIRAKKGDNLRKILLDEGLNVYQNVARVVNCRGKQRCGTCIVDVTAGAAGTNRRSIDESSTLRDNPEAYRLSCITFVYGDVDVRTFPKIGADQ